MVVPGKSGILWWKGGCAWRRARKLALRMRTFSVGLQKGKMKAIMLAFLLGSSIAVGAIDPREPSDWSWRAPLTIPISGEVGVSWIGGREYYFGSRGKIVI